MGKFNKRLVFIIYAVAYLSIHINASINSIESQPPADEARSAKRRLVGRHVCTRSKVVMTTVSDMQSYCKPTYQTYLRRCVTGGSQLCTGYRVVYELAYRPAKRIVAQTQTTYTCCPGWAHSRPLADDCKKAVCAKPCQNGGTCVKPDQCLCAPGWTGQFCESDIDECHSQGHIFCEHSCVNIRGSFRCSCRDGYVLHSDGRTCKTVSDPGIKVQSKVSPKEFEEINRKIQRLEQHMSSVLNLKGKVESLGQLLHQHLKSPNLRNERDAFVDQPTESSTTRKTPTATESTDDRINSLSEQIAILEERLAECSCLVHDTIQVPPLAR